MKRLHKPNPKPISDKPIAIRIDRGQYERLKSEAERHNRSAVAQLKTILYFYFTGINAD
jgi:hypothetical protein